MCVENEVRLTAVEVTRRCVVGTLDLSPEIGLLPIKAVSMGGDGLLHIRRGFKVNHTSLSLSVHVVDHVLISVNHRVWHG